MYTYYRTSLPDPAYMRDISFTINGHMYKLSFYYSDEMFRVWNDFETKDNAKAKADPLVNKVGQKVYNYDYLYIEYYTAISSAVDAALVTDVTTWLAQQNELPASILNLTQEEQVSIVVTRILACRALLTVRDTYKTLCRWQYTFMVDGEIVDDGFVELWSWRAPNDEVSFKFTSDLDYIRFEDLNKVMLYVRVNNG